MFFFPYEKHEWVEGYEDGKYDLVVFDEFHGQKSITFMNQFLDGSTMWIPQRNAGTTKEQYVPCIVNANHLPDAYYSGSASTADQLSAFVARFITLSFNSLIKILI